MRSLIQQDYVNTDSWTSNVASSISIYRSPITATRVINPLLPSSQRVNTKTYLQKPLQSQHQYNLSKQQTRSHHYHNGLDLFTTPPIESIASKSIAKRSNITQFELQEPQKPLQLNEFELNEDSVDSVKVADHFLSPWSQRTSRAAQGYRLRKKYDKWADITRAHHQIDNAFYDKNKSIHQRKKEELRKDLLKQMNVRQVEKKKQLEKKRMDYEAMKKLIKMDEMAREMARKEKYKSQQQFKQELDKIACIQRKILAQQKQHNLKNQRLIIEENNKKEKQERNHAMQKILNEKKCWNEMKKNVEMHHKIRQIEREKEKESDRKAMKAYSLMLQNQELKRKGFLKNIQKEMNERDDANFNILKEKDRKMREESERFCRYQQLKAHQLSHKQIDEKNERENKKRSYISFLDKQIEEKQRNKRNEIERMKRERIEIENHIKKQQSKDLQLLLNQKRVKSAYGHDLQQQKLHHYEKQIQAQYCMNDKESLYHKQYLRYNQKKQHLPT